MYIVSSWTLLLAGAFQRRYRVLVGYRYVPSLRYNIAAVSTVPLSPPLLTRYYSINPHTGSTIIVITTYDRTLTMVCLLNLSTAVKLNFLAYSWRKLVKTELRF